MDGVNMAWNAFCWNCRRFFEASAPSDVIGANGQPGFCPKCDRRLDWKDENNPPSYSEPTPAGFD
jgi:hypothetical protein